MAATNLLYRALGVREGDQCRLYWVLPTMAEELASAREAAQRLGISVASFYAWLRQSDEGSLVIRGQSATIDYLQGGPQGQGRIKLEASEIERIKELMRVRPGRAYQHSAPIRRDVFPGITAPLGRPRC